MEHYVNTVYLVVTFCQFVVIAYDLSSIRINDSTGSFSSVYVANRCMRPGAPCLWAIAGRNYRCKDSEFDSKDMFQKPEKMTLVMFFSEFGFSRCRRNSDLFVKAAEMQRFSSSFSLVSS